MACRPCSGAFDHVSIPYVFPLQLSQHTNYSSTSLLGSQINRHGLHGFHVLGVATDRNRGTVFGERTLKYFLSADNVLEREKLYEPPGSIV